MLSCLCNNNTIIVFNAAPPPARLWCTALLTSVWSPPLALVICCVSWFKVGVIVSLTDKHNTTVGLARLSKSMRSGTSEMDFSLRARWVPWKCAPYFHFCWHSLTWVSGCVACVGWRMWLKISVHVWERKALSLWLCDYVWVWVCVCACVSAVSQNLESITTHHHRWRRVRRTLALPWNGLRQQRIRL